MKLDACTWKPLTFAGDQPKTRSEPKAVVLHTNGAPAPTGLFAFYQGRAGNAADPNHLAMAHVQIQLDGTAWQYVETTKIVGHAWDANDFTVGIETEDKGTPELLPWTDAQIEKILAICRELGVPAIACPEHGPNGVGYHQEYGSWNQSSHNCPGSKRRPQVAEIIQELGGGGDMAFDAEGFAKWAGFKDGDTAKQFVQGAAGLWDAADGRADEPNNANRAKTWTYLTSRDGGTVELPAGTKLTLPDGATFTIG